MFLRSLVALLLILSQVNLSHNQQIPCDGEYNVFTFNQKTTHFNYQNQDTFSQKYITCTKYFNETNKNTPIFLYTGNEGPIMAFLNNSGAIFELAKELQAIVVFIEHRYYGESLVEKRNFFNYLSVEETIQDFVDITIFLKYEKWKLNEKASVIAWGGSYGGKLSSWMRMKFPNLINGAVAASAPVTHFQNEVDPEEYFRIITNVWKNVGCEDIVKKGFLIMNEMKMKKEFEKIERDFNTCEKIESEKDVQLVIELVENAVQGLTIANYPTSNNFLRPLPQWAVKYTCEKMKQKGIDALKAMKDIVSVYFNYTGMYKCVDINWPMTPTIEDTPWNFQACSQIIGPMERNGINDFFLPKKWDLNKFISDCQNTYPNVVSDPFYVIKNYHGKIIKHTSNIIYTNGKNDPWSSGSAYEENLDCDECYSIVIENGAHHVDLRFLSENDTPDIIEARKKVKEIIKKWLQHM